MTPIFRMLLLTSRLPAGNVYRDTAVEMLQHLEEIRDKNIEQIAEICHTNPVTLSRLVRKIGCKNFSEFRQTYDEAIKSYPLINRCIPIQYTDASDSSFVYIDFIKSVADSCTKYVTDALLQEVAEAMHRAGQVHLYAAPYNPLENSMLLHDVLLTGKKIHYYNDWDSIKMNLKEIGADSFVLFMPSTMFMEQSDMLKIFERIINVGAGSVFLTSAQDIMTHFAPGYILKFDSTNTVANTFPEMFIVNMLMMKHRKLFLEGKNEGEK